MGMEEPSTRSVLTRPGCFFEKKAFRATRRVLRHSPVGAVLRAQGDRVYLLSPKLISFHFISFHFISFHFFIISFHFANAFFAEAVVSADESTSRSQGREILSHFRTDTLC